MALFIIIFFYIKGPRLEGPCKYDTVYTTPGQHMGSANLENLVFFGGVVFF